ncbi:hypothetical protein BDV96DRAFT_171997 [Lophiotrema nucula]|uniref:Uncharacterized protein n=1 Tax=Lophiotrema nucula TaxID=690887 RepID=A0A6A5YYD2_9PLEO|nr:hypothetical protein BDV96DRAFT_171997 [Lophiotrema nucula]
MQAVSLVVDLNPSGQILVELIQGQWQSETPWRCEGNSDACVLRETALIIRLGATSCGEQSSSKEASLTPEQGHGWLALAVGRPLSRPRCSAGTACKGWLLAGLKPSAGMFIRVLFRRGLVCGGTMYDIHLSSICNASRHHHIFSCLEQHRYVCCRGSISRRCSSAILVNNHSFIRCLESS